MQYAANYSTHLDFLIINRVTKLPILAIETDGYSFHNDQTIQHHRDLMKDHILSSYGLPLLRLSTKGSGEKDKVISMLMQFVWPHNLYVHLNSSGTYPLGNPLHIVESIATCFYKIIERPSSIFISQTVIYRFVPHQGILIYRYSNFILSVKNSSIMTPILVMAELMQALR